MTKNRINNTKDFLMDRRAFLAASAAAIASFKIKAYAESKTSLDDVLDMSTMSIAKLIGTKEVSSVEVVQAHLDRIALVNPKINAVCTLAAERAIKEARKADSELAHGNILGPLHGVPMTIKDAFDTEGITTTYGTVGRKTFVPDKDATIVHRLRESGAILLGKTNTSELTMDFDTFNRLFESTVNPYNIKKSPSGSSGGSAAIIASGGSPFDFGSDTGGSVRLPSSFCGIAGIRPTVGLLPLTGHVTTYEQGPLASLTQPSPMSRFVDDLYPLLKITAGPDGIDKLTRPLELRDPTSVKLKELRVAFHTNNGIKAASAEIAEAVRAGVSSLSGVVKEILLLGVPSI